MRCKKCLMNEQRKSLRFFEDGVCELCKLQERDVDWRGRWKELENLCDQHRGKKPYDMAIPLSGGKDSHWQVGLFKETFNMNPVGIMVDNATWTKTGRDNFYNLSDRFDIDIITYTPSVKRMREKTRQGFFESLWPEKYWDDMLYLKPLEIARSLGIGFVAWGEDTGGFDSSETPSALKLLPERKREPFEAMDVIFLSYYVQWNRYEHVEYAKANGFKGLDDTQEWDRDGLQGFDFEQVDTIGYLVNQYCKFIKFGFSNQTELCSDAIRLGRMTRGEAIKRVNEYDWRLDTEMMWDFCEGLGISNKEFWDTIDKFANRDLLKKDVDGNWKLKEPVK